jgi:hypothetical protein
MLNRLLSTNRRGQILLMVTFAMIPMVAMVGLVTDIGYMRYVQRSAQKAADAAALAAITHYTSSNAGSVYTCGSGSTAPSWVCNTPTPANPNPYSCPGGLTSASNPVEDACLYAQQNGFNPTLGSRQSVFITSGASPSPSNPIPTASGVNNGAWWITVRAVQSVPNLFSAVLGNKTGLVAARASAAIQPGLACVYALDPSAQGAYSQNGNTTFNANCGIYVDSNNPSAAMQGVGAAIVNVTSINVVGGYSWPLGSINPTPNTGVAPFPDPLKNLQPPSPCDSTTGCENAHCANNSKPFVVDHDQDVPFGTYCGGILVKSGEARLSGRYILVGGGIVTQDTTASVTGSNVFLYNTYDSHNSFQPILFKAGSKVQIAAPDNDPPYSGILYFEDRQYPNYSTTMLTDSFQGGSTSYFQGTIYASASLVQFAGNPSLSVTSTTTAKYTVVVARQFSVQGTSNMNNDFSNVAGGNPIKVVSLVE